MIRASNSYILCVYVYIVQYTTHTHKMVKNGACGLLDDSSAHFKATSSSSW